MLGIVPTATPAENAENSEVLPIESPRRVRIHGSLSQRTQPSGLDMAKKMATSRSQLMVLTRSGLTLANLVK